MPRSPVPCSLTVSDLFAKWQQSMLPLYKPSTRRFISITLVQLQRDFKGIPLPRVRLEARRLISISEHLVAALERLKTPRDGTVFTNEFGRVLDPEKVVQRHLRPLLRKLGIRSGGLHAFRHFNATLMDTVAVSMKTRQARLGHSSSQTTLQLYTHILRDEDRKAAMNVGRCLSESKQDNGVAKRGMCWWTASTTASNSFGGSTTHAH